MSPSLALPHPIQAPPRKPYPLIQPKPMRYLPLLKSSKLPSKSSNPMQGTASAIDRAYLYRRYIQPMPYIEYSRSGSRWSIQSAPPTHASIHPFIYPFINPSPRNRWLCISQDIVACLSQRYLELAHSAFEN